MGPTKNEKGDFPGGPVAESLIATARDPASIHGPGRFHVPQGTKPVRTQLLKPTRPRACVHKEATLSGKPAHRKGRVAPIIHSKRKPRYSNRYLAQPKINR